MRNYGASDSLDGVVSEALDELAEKVVSEESEDGLQKMGSIVMVKIFSNTLNCFETILKCLKYLEHSE